MKKLTENTQKGFTSIELLVATVVFLLAMFPMVKSILKNTKMTTHAIVNARATSLALDLAGQIKALRWDENGSAPIAPGNRTPPLQLGPDTPGETDQDKSTYDDIDDFNGYSDSVGPYERSVQVRYVEQVGAAPNFEILYPSPGDNNPKDFKKIIVSVQGPGEQQAQISEVIANTAR